MTIKVFAKEYHYPRGEEGRVGLSQREVLSRLAGATLHVLDNICRQETGRESRSGGDFRRGYVKSDVRIEEFEGGYRMKTTTRVEYDPSQANPEELIDKLKKGYSKDPVEVDEGGVK